MAGCPRWPANWCASCSNSVVTTTMAGFRSSSTITESWTLHDVHDPQLPSPTTPAATNLAQSSTSSRVCSAVGPTPRRSRARAPRRRRPRADPTRSRRPSRTNAMPGRVEGRRAHPGATFRGRRWARTAVALGGTGTSTSTVSVRGVAVTAGRPVRHRLRAPDRSSIPSHLTAGTCTRDTCRQWFPSAPMAGSQPSSPAHAQTPCSASPRCLSCQARWR